MNPIRKRLLNAGNIRPASSAKVVLPKGIVHVDIAAVRARQAELHNVPLPPPPPVIIVRERKVLVH